MSKNISIKGTRDGLTVSLGEGDIQDLLEELDAHLKVQGAFFKGGTVAVQLGARSFDQSDLEKLSELLNKYDMALRTIVASDERAVEAAQAMGLRISPPITAAKSSENSEAAAAPVRTAVPVSGALYIRRTVRSGQVIRHSGPVVVLGDVNPSGEIWAGADVIIWGRAHGMICAGISGEPGAVVCALELNPLMLRIGDLVARGDDNHKARTKTGPEMARIREGQIVVEPWDGIELGE